ncbi:hypothetical protein HK101_007488, partial [Irineochytrium annulatum]
MDADEAGKVNGALMAKEREFLAILQHSPPSDLTMLLDTLLPCVTSFSSTSRVFIVGVQCMVFFGKLLHRLQPKDSFSRLLSAKEHVTLLSQVSAAHSQRIPFIARILDAFIGPGASDSERIRTLLTIKSFVNAAAAGQDTVNAQGGPNASSASGAGGASSNGQSGESPNAFVFLLCALETVRSKPVGPRTNREDGLPPAIPQPGNNNNNNNSNTNSQHITLILSECLTVINTHRRSASTGQIFGSAGAIMEMCAAIHLLSLLAESAAQSRHAQQSTSDDEHSPVTDVDEGRTPSPHRKPPSTAVGMIPDNVAGDVIDAEGKGLLRAVMHYDCPACLQKAYVRFLAGVLAVVRDGHPLVKAAREAAGGVLKWITDDVLRSAPSLRYHPPLGAPFVRGLLAIDEPTRLQLLSLPPSTPTGSNPPLTASSLDLLRATAELHTTRFGDHVDLTWDLPFVERSTDAGRVVDGWWAFGVGMGLARVVKGPEKAGLTKEGLQILLAVLMAIVCPGKLQQTMGSNRGMNGTGGAHLEAPVKLEMLSMSEIPTIEELTSAAVPIATTTASRLPVLRKQTAEAGNDDPMAPWSHMYEFLIADLFVLVPNDETSELACCALEAFTRALPPESSLLNHLPLVVASMARLAIKGDQAVEKTPRERFVQWVVRWAKGGRETGGGWNCVVPVKEDVRKGVKRGMREVVGNFMKGFPGLCREHAEEWSVLVATATAAMESTTHTAEDRLLDAIDAMKGPAAAMKASTLTMDAAGNGADDGFESAAAAPAAEPHHPATDLLQDYRHGASHPSFADVVKESAGEDTVPEHSATTETDVDRQIAQHSQAQLNDDDNDPSFAEVVKNSSGVRDDDIPVDENLKSPAVAEVETPAWSESKDESKDSAGSSTAGLNFGKPPLANDKDAFPRIEDVYRAPGAHRDDRSRGSQDWMQLP